MEESIVLKVRELGEAIMESKTAKNYREAELKQMQDVEAQKLASEYNLHREQWIAQAKEGGLTKEKLEQARKKIDDEYEKLAANETIAHYLSCKKEWDNMVTAMNQMLNYYLTGETEGGCSGNCSSCHGCH